MNDQANAIPESSVQPQAMRPAVISPTWLFYWAIRRELWEHRAIYVAPIAAAGLCLFGFLVSSLTLSYRMRAIMVLDPAKQRAALHTPHALAAALIMGTGFIVGIFYTLDALYGERRDRSILFWKSLPVSDLIIVLLKITVPLFIIPLLTFVVTIATQFTMLVVSSVVVAGSGMSAAPLWTQSSFFHFSVILFYHVMTIHGLWYAPIYAWMLLVSAWAPRAPFVWAFLPPFVIWGVEKVAFNTSYFLNLLEARVTGSGIDTITARGSAAGDPMGELVPAHFFTEPGLWIGLLVAAGLLFAAARVRRYRGPV